MKKFTKINYILTFILVFCIGATLPILIGSSHVCLLYTSDAADE